MRGLLFYDTEGAKRNEWFIGRLIESARELGHELTLVIHPTGTESAISSRPDFAIVRVISPSLNKRLESLGIPTFNNHETSRIANNKWLTYLFANELGIPVMKTEHPKSPSDITLPYPFVLKTVDGHGGSEVFYIENADKCKHVFALLQEKCLISQEMSSEPGVDMRVYTLGGKIIACAKRSSDNDFRSNFSLGGKAEISVHDRDISAVVEKVYHALGCDFVGVDFIRHNGRWILNEIEDVVGTRMLYSLTDIDAAKVYVKYIIDKLNHKA